MGGRNPYHRRYVVQEFKDGARRIIQGRRLEGYVSYTLPAGNIRYHICR